MERFSACVGLAVFSVVLTSACGSGDAVSEPADSPDVGKVVLTLLTVPATVQCIEVSVANYDYPWQEITTLQLAATPNAASWSGVVPLLGFTSVNLRVNARAFNAACGSTGPTPKWVADELVIPLTPGKVPTAALTFRQNFDLMASGNFAPSVVDIAVGGLEGGNGTVGLVLADGTVKLFGSVANPTNLTGVVELAIGYDHACARKTDGTVWCWGQNLYGQLGNGTTTASPSTPVRAGALAGTTTISAGYWTTSANANGPTTQLAFCWGNGVSGAMGSNGTANALFPSIVQRVIGGVNNAIGQTASISTNVTHSCAVHKAGQVMCWGDNSSGMLGNGGTAQSLTAVFTSMTGATSVAVGLGHTCGVDSIGRVYCWGANSSGMLGNGGSADSSVPVLVSGLGPAFGKPVAEVTPGNSHTCARAVDGDVFCWGNGSSGQLGTGTAAAVSTPVLVLSGAAAIATGSAGATTCALMKDASVKCWGDNAAGQFGDGTLITHFNPTTLKL